MKLSVSIADEDVAFLDRYAKDRRLPSRSAAIQDAVAQLRVAGLGDDYEAAWREWEVSGDGEAWDATAGDRPQE